MPACDLGHLAPWIWWGNWIISLGGKQEDQTSTSRGKIGACANAEMTPGLSVLLQERDLLLRCVWHLWILSWKKRLGAGVRGVWGEKAAAGAQVSAGEASSVLLAHELKLECILTLTIAAWRPSTTGTLWPTQREGNHGR